MNLPFVIPGRKTPKAFEFHDGTLHTVTFAIRHLVVRCRITVVPFRWNDRLNPPSLKFMTCYPIAVPAITDQPTWSRLGPSTTGTLDASPFQKGNKPHHFVAFTAREKDGQRFSAAFAFQMNLGAETAS